VSSGPFLFSNDLWWRFQLLRRQRFLDGSLFAFLQRDYTVHRAIASHGDIDDIGAGIEIEIEGRSLVERAVVHHDLRALRLCLDAYRGHTCGIALLEHFRELAASGMDFVRTPERGQRQSHVR
jgi:hypothetical protein